MCSERPISKLKYVFSNCLVVLLQYFVLRSVPGGGGGLTKPFICVVPVQCHLKLRDVPSAMEWLHKAYQLPTTTPDVSIALHHTIYYIFHVPPYIL